VLRITLARVVSVVLLRLGLHRDRCWLLIVLIGHVTEDLFTIALIVLGLIKQRPEASECLLQLADEVKDTADKRRLVHSENLNNTLNKRLDTADIQIVLKGFEQQVQVKGLL
jgi:adenylate kinase family enzyme